MKLLNINKLLLCDIDVSYSSENLCDININNTPYFLPSFVIYQIYSNLINLHHYPFASSNII